MPELWIATSVPVPMAMPTLAWARAGASFTPSPAMATMRPLLLQAANDRAFLIGQHLGLDFVHAQLSGHGLGGAAIVAGEHDDAHPLGPQDIECLARWTL